jgi:transposase
VYEKFNIEICKSTAARIIKGFNCSIKSVQRIPIARNDLNTLEVRYQYAQNYIALPTQFSEDQLIFIDEVGFNVSMRCNRGRSLVGSPAVKRLPRLRSRNISVCCAMNKDGILLYQSQDYAFNKLSFKGFLENLILKLRDLNFPCAMLIMDNVAFHKSLEVREVIELSEFNFMFLPPYSPFLNPIENMFSKWKNMVKRSNPCNEEDLMNSITSSVLTITASDCQGYFRNMSAYIPRCINRQVIED